MTVAEILEQAKALSWLERKELVKLLIDSLDAPGYEKTHDILEFKGIAAHLADHEDVDESVSSRQRHLSELRGLGKEIWEGVDAQEYVNQLRKEWDNRP